MPDMITCPTCGKRLAAGRAMGNHLRDAHGMTGMEAHLISNPGDKQAAGSHTAQK